MALSVFDEFAIVRTQGPFDTTNAACDYRPPKPKWAIALFFDKFLVRGGADDGMICACVSLPHSFHLLSAVLPRICPI
jgi:hypothetical protein